MRPYNFTHESSFLAAPSEVLNLMLTYNGSHFVISWEQPLQPNGILNYTVNFTGVSLVTSEQVASESVVVTELMYQPVVMGEVYSFYTAIVVSQTGGGMGPGRSVDFTTPQEGM